MSPDDFKTWRGALNLSQQEAADRLGISRGSVENYERGHRREDRRPVEIPLPVQRSCDAIRLDEAAARGDVGLLTDDLRERVFQIAHMLLSSPVKP